jgi:hypothetical protein
MVVERRAEYPPHEESMGNSRKRSSRSATATFFVLSVALASSEAMSDDLSKTLAIAPLPSLVFASPSSLPVRSFASWGVRSSMTGTAPISGTLGHPLLGRISRNLDASGAGAELRYLGDRRTDQYETGAVVARGHSLLGATRGAVTSLLLDMVEEPSGIDDFLDRFQSRASSTQAGDRPRAGYDLGVSGFLPKLDVRLPTTGAVATRLSFSALGRAGIDLGAGKRTRMRFHADYDVLTRYADVRCFVRF